MGNVVSTKLGSLQQRLFIGERRALRMKWETIGYDSDMTTPRAIVLLGMLGVLARTKYTTHSAAGRMAKALEVQQQAPWTSTESHLRMILAGYVDVNWHKRDGFDDAINKLTAVTWTDGLLQAEGTERLDAGMGDTDKPAFQRLEAWSACELWKRAVAQTAPVAMSTLRVWTQPFQDRLGMDFWTLYRPLLERLGFLSCLGGGDGCLALWRQAKDAASNLALTNHEREDAAGMALTLTRTLIIATSLDTRTRNRLTKLTGEDWAGMLILVGANINAIGWRGVIDALAEEVPMMSKRTLAHAMRELPIQRLRLRTAKVTSLESSAVRFDKIEAALRARALALRVVNHGLRQRQRA